LSIDDYAKIEEAIIGGALDEDIDLE